MDRTVERIARHTYALVAFLMIVVASGWTVVARTSWIAGLLGLSLTALAGFAALAAVDPEDGEAPTRPVARPAAARPEPASEPTWVTGTRLRPSR